MNSRDLTGLPNNITFQTNHSFAFVGATPAIPLGNKHIFIKLLAGFGKSIIIRQISFV